MSPRSRSLPSSFSSAKSPALDFCRPPFASVEDLRRQVREDILKEMVDHPLRVCLPRGSSVQVLISSGTESSVVQGSSNVSSTRLTILGPHPPQLMEVSSSEGSNTTTVTVSTNPRLRKSASTSELSPLIGGSGQSLSPLIPIRHTKSFVDMSQNPKLESAPSDQVDWVEYSAHILEVEEIECLEEDTCLSELTVSEPFEAEDFNPDILINDITLSPSPPVDPCTLSNILRQYVTPRLRDIGSHSRRVSRRPNLPTIYQKAASASPVDGISAMRTRPRCAAELDTCLIGSPGGSNCTDTESEGSVVGRKCIACGRKKASAKWMMMIPCGHIACSTCFSSSLSAVAVSRLGSKCPGCLDTIKTFTNLEKPSDFTAPLLGDNPVEARSDPPAQPYSVLRIDNVAWDITPQIVANYLPSGVLPGDHSQSIHILLNRFDGRTKDYMYVEVVSFDAARKVLKHRQNSFMPGGPLTGGRKRPVTITLVSQEELLNEELHALLALCQAAVQSPPLINPSLHHTTSYVAPNGLAHFVKSRHGPFHALMSIMTKMRGRDSPIYWDMFYVVSGFFTNPGAMTALGNASIKFASSHQLSPPEADMKTEDLSVLEKLSTMFANLFRGGKTSDTEEYFT